MANKHVVQFDEIESDLEKILKGMAEDFGRIDPAKYGGEITYESALEFSKPYADKVVKYLTDLECEFEETLIREEVHAIINEFDTVDRAVYAKTDEQEPTQGIAILVSNHRTMIMQHLQEKDEGYSA